MRIAIGFGTGLAVMAVVAMAPFSGPGVSFHGPLANLAMAWIAIGAIASVGDAVRSLRSS